MNNDTDHEFQRILSNPENEIVSESLKGRLSYTLSAINLMIAFNEKKFECTLDSFSRSLGKKKLSRASILLGLDATRLILAGDGFVISCDDPNIYTTSSDFETIDCFKYSNDIYVLELSTTCEETLND